MRSLQVLPTHQSRRAGRCGVSLHETPYQAKPRLLSHGASLIFVALILFCSKVNAFTASFEQITSGTGIPEPQTRFFEIKDNKIRIEMDTPKGRGIAIIENDTMLSYVPSQNKAVRIKTGMYRDMSVLTDYMSYLVNIGARAVGSEKVGPYDCDIYEYTDPRINMPSKVWLWKAYQFPVKVEIKTPDGVMTTIMKDVKVGIDIDDSEFMLPPGVEIIEEAQMMEE